MNNPVERVLVVSNPSSSRASEVRASVIDTYHAHTPENMEIVEFAITSKDRTITAGQIAEVIQPNDRIIVAGGDGTGNVVINAIMQAPDSTGVRVGFLPYGNFNDMASTFSDKSAKRNPLQLLTESETVDVHPLDIKINNEHHQYALLYTTIGWTALAAAEFDKPHKRQSLQQGSANLAASLMSTAKMYFETRHSSYLAPFYRPGHTNHQENTTDILAINGPIMAKIIRSKRAYYETNQFLSNDLNVSKFFANRTLLGRSGLNYLLGTSYPLPGTLRSRDDIEFVTPSILPLQVDGEISEIGNVSQFSVSKDQEPDAKHITVIKTSR